MNAAGPPFQSQAKLWLTAFVVSVLINALLILAFGFWVVANLVIHAPRNEAASFESVALIVPQVVAGAPIVDEEETTPAVPPSAKPSFARTSPDQADEKPDSPDFIGERNTRATSDAAPLAEAPDLHSQKGREPLWEDEMETTESDYQDGDLAHNRSATPDSPAMQQPDKFHGLGKFKPDTGETEPATTPTYSQLLGTKLSDFADHNNRIVAITAAMAGGTGLSIFEKRHPDRYHDVGIAEEHAALFACGLATQGYKPFLTIYSTFMQRAYDMIIHDIALQNLNVALCMDRAGLSGDDGPTHHGLFDIGYLRHIPNFVFMQPKDEEEFADMLWTMANYHRGPIAIRYPRGAGTGAKPKEHPQILEIGQSEVLRHGRRVVLLGLGNMVEMAEQTADLLAAQGIDAAVINARWIKPLDTQTLEFFARAAEVVCTFEDHVLHNGYGAAVVEALAEARITTPVVRIGWPDKFIDHGKVDILREQNGVTAAAAVKKILAELAHEPAAAKATPAA
jgi:transketolase C-terminal domain/subunit